MLSGTYEFLPQDRVIFGRPASEAVVETADRMAKRRLLIVASKTLSRKTDVVSKIQAALAERCVGVFDECIEHVPRASILSLAAAVRKREPDLIVTVGGGTPIDTVKVMLLTMAAGVTDEPGFDAIRIRVEADGTRVVPTIKDPPLRQIIVPTTLSGAEFSNLGGCTDPARKVKDLYTGRLIGGQVVILDPAATLYHSRRAVAFDGHPRRGPRGRDDLLAQSLNRSPTPPAFMHWSCCPSRCRQITQNRRISAVASTASSQFGSQRPVSAALIGVLATASVISLELSPTCLMDIARASCCQAFCAGIDQSMPLGKQSSHERSERRTGMLRRRSLSLSKLSDNRRDCATWRCGPSTTTRSPRVPCRTCLSAVTHGRSLTRRKFAKYSTWRGSSCTDRGWHNDRLWNYRNVL